MAENLMQGDQTASTYEEDKPFKPLVNRVFGEMRQPAGVRQPTPEEMQVAPVVTEPSISEVGPQQPIAQPVQMPKSDDPDYMARAVDKLTQANQLAVQAGEQQAAAQDSYYGRMQELSDQRRAQREQELAQRQQMHQERALEMEQAQNDYLAAQQEAGKSYWEDRSIGAKIGAAIVQGLGAYSAAMTGTQNYAQQTIQNAVKQDAELKMRKARLAKDRTSDIAKRYDFLMDQLGDEAAVKDMILADNYQVAKNKLEQMLAKTKSKEVQSKGMQALGELDMQIGQLKQSALKASMDAQTARQEYLVPEYGQYATSKEGAKKINNLAASVNTANDGIDRLLEIADLPAKSLSPEIRAEAETTAGLLMGALREPIVGPGAVSDAERALLEKVIANPATIFSLDAKSKRSLQTLKQRLGVNLQQTAKAYGIDVPNPTKVRSAGGQNIVRGSGGLWRKQ